MTATALSQSHVYSVSEITRLIRGALENQFSDVRIQGEISNFKQHTSGHVYFTIKDESAQIAAVLWRSRTTSIQFTPQDGMKVVAFGRITVYETRGIYQLDVRQLQPVGIGELQLAFEQLKENLMKEGLFDASHKKPLPKYPKTIGIVTSPTGAAIRDMVNIIGRRFPPVELVIAPVRVQGYGAAQEIAQALRDLNSYGGIDVIIVGRGGGSLEDLWAFNEEIVARAIYESAIPVVSAVGHEVDTTISDFVADLRAPTPSAAAELVVPNRLDLLDILRNSCYTVTQRLRERVESERNRVQYLIDSYSFNQPRDLVRQYSQRVDEADRRMRDVLRHRFEVLHGKSEELQKRMESVNPEQILRRGYVIVYRGDTVISSARRISVRDLVRMKFHDGVVRSRVEAKETDAGS